MAYCNTVADIFQRIFIEDCVDAAVLTFKILPPILSYYSIHPVLHAIFLGLQTEPHSLGMDSILSLLPLGFSGQLRHDILCHGRDSERGVHAEVHRNIGAVHHVEIGIPVDLAVESHHPFIRGFSHHRTS